MKRLPDYQSGRFFLSPILGCNAQCTFCYIYENGYNNRISLNQYSILESINKILEHDCYISGENGSIISIGAWGDPFPLYSKKAQIFSFDWLREVCKLGNPVQIMSRYELTDDIITNIADLNKGSNQILFSTSISSILQYKIFEPYADEPTKRINTLKKLKEKGVQVNVMVKPFLEGITDLEVQEIANLFKEGNIEFCVVGGFYTSEEIFKKMPPEWSLSKDNNISIEILDCSSQKKYTIDKPNALEGFISTLNNLGIKAFKKSSCVNSYISKTENPAGYYKHDPNNYCIKCGVCQKG